jgi:cytochrome P450
MKNDIVMTSWAAKSCINLLMKRQSAPKPTWNSDRLDSPLSPEIEAAYFDDSLQAWVLSSYADNLLAFRSTSLFPSGPSRDAAFETPDPESTLKMHAETREALSPANLRQWREHLRSEAGALVRSLPLNLPVDLVGEYARPLCLSLAAVVTNIDRQAAEYLCEISEPVSASAAEPYDVVLKSSAKSVDATLRSYFHSGPEPLRDSGFVALAHTMPCLLANAWFALLKDAEQWSILHRELWRMEQATEELLRTCGLPRILSRKAIEDCDINGVRVKKGERIVLRIYAANRDREHFSQPNQVNVRRRGIKHLAFGAGPHACVGASLIRMVAITISRPLLERFAWAKVCKPVEWKGGSVFLSPSSLWVHLGERSP